MNEPTDTPTPERYHCFKSEYGFAIYLPDSGGIEFTQVFSEATEATKDDWSDVLGMELVHFQFVPATIYVEKLQRENQQLDAKISSLESECQNHVEHMALLRQENQQLLRRNNVLQARIQQATTDGPWKEEDPRMLREQIRVADVAFNHLKEENQQLQRERDEAKHSAQQAKEHYEFYRQKVSDYIGAEQEWIKSRNHFKQLAEEWRKEAAHLLDCYSTADEMPLNTHPVQGQISTVTFNRLRKALQQPKKDE